MALNGSKVFYMACWKNKPNTYIKWNFIEIPEGDHRVQICNVVVERFSKGKKCFEITLKVSGHHGKIWHHIWYDPEKTVECGKSFYPFFYSFEIDDHDLKHYKKWIGKYGAIRVKHIEYSEGYEARIVSCLYGEQKDKLTPWSEGPTDRCYDYCVSNGNPIF